MRYEMFSDAGNAAVGRIVSELVDDPGYRSLDDLYQVACSRLDALSRQEDTREADDTAVREAVWSQLGRQLRERYPVYREEREVGLSRDTWRALLD